MFWCRSDTKSEIPGIGKWEGYASDTAAEKGADLLLCSLVLRRPCFTSCLACSCQCFRCSSADETLASPCMFSTAITFFHSLNGRFPLPPARVVLG
jgi:hypothetical protein